MQFNRFLSGEVEKYLKLSKNILLLGPRQTGKSTLIENYLKTANKNKLIYKLQDIRTYEDIVRSPGMVFDAAEKKMESGIPLVLYIDEIQKIPKLLDGCQYLIDEYKNKITVIITGSSARKLRRGEVNLLPGRVFVENLHSLIFPEIMKSEEQRILPISVKTSKENNLRFSLEELLLYGTLPGVLKELNLANKILDSYVSTYLQEEIRAEALSRNLGDFSKFLQFSALESGGAPNLTNLSKETGVAINTIKNYFYLLEDTLLTYSIPPFTKRARKQILSTPRYVFYDLGIRNAASRTGLNSKVLKTEIGGKLFEQLITLELIKRIKYAYPYYKYFFWRTKTGLEVDFIIQTNEGEIIPVEIKYTDVPHKRHLSHLKIFMEEFNCKKGFLIGTFKRAMKLTDKITAIPWDEI